MDDAKERVKQELKELNEKIGKLSVFLFGSTLLDAGISTRMTDLLTEQLRHMQEYARILQLRLKIWGKTDADIRAAEEAEIHYRAY